MIKNNPVFYPILKNLLHFIMTLSVMHNGWRNHQNIFMYEYKFLLNLRVFERVCGALWCQSVGCSCLCVIWVFPTLFWSAVCDVRSLYLEVWCCSWVRLCCILSVTGWMTLGLFLRWREVCADLRACWSSGAVAREWPTGTRRWTWGGAEALFT